MADDDEEATEAPKSNKKLIIFGLLGLLIVGGGGAGAAYFLGASKATDEVAEQEGDDVPDLPAAAVYVALTPAFTVNFKDDGKSRFLQVTLEAMTRDAAVAESIEQNMPMIRNNLVLLFSSKDSSQLETLEGKEALREETRAGIQEVVTQEGAEGDVEAVYFTSFVMQ